MKVFGYFLKLKHLLGKPQNCYSTPYSTIEAHFLLHTDFIRTFFVVIRTEIAGFRP